MLVHREWAFEWPPKKPPVYPDAMPTPDAPADAALIENLSRQLADDIRAYRRWLWRRRLGRIVRLGLIAGLIMTVFHRNWHGFWWLFLIFGGSKVTDARADRRKRTAGLLARTRDPRAVNVLAVAHRSGDPATRAVAAKALAEVLPMLKASDAERITPEGMRALIAILNIRGTGVAGLIDMGLILAVLDALKQVGDARAIPAVERLIAMPYFINVIVRISERWHYRAIGDSVRRVRSSAEECLEVLRVRAKLERDRNTLLRPAERPDGEERVRLRPPWECPSVRTSRWFVPHIRMDLRPRRKCPSRASRGGWNGRPRRARSRRKKRAKPFALRVRLPDPGYRYGQETRTRSQAPLAAEQQEGSRPRGGREAV